MSSGLAALVAVALARAAISTTATRLSGRARSNSKWRVIKRLGRGDDLVEIEFPRALRREHPELPATFMARAVRYRRKGFQQRVPLTSLLDPEKYPAVEVAELYHKRWELELGYDEIKTEMLEREEVRLDLRHFILPPRRSERRYARHVKIKMSGYARND